jgi:hypothetical protein
VKAPGIAIMAIAVVAVATVMPTGAAHADVAFRKKKPAASEAAPAEITPSGGDTTAAATEGGDAPATDGEAPPPVKTEFVPQAEDKDRPTDPSLLDQTPADAAIHGKAKVKHEDTPIYKKWQLWAIVGGVVAAGLAIYGTTVLVHSMNGGDIRPCGTDFATACFGQGR